MFESKINRGKANGYAPLDSAGKVPLDKTYVGANGTSGTSGISGTSGVNGSQGLSGTSFTWGGAWDATNYYNFINVVVEYSGSSYICIDADDNFGRNPSEESTYWNLMAASGSSNLTNIDLSTFATTGSNIFFGEQAVSGNLVLTGNIGGALALVDNVEIFTSQINFVPNSSGEPGSNLSTIQLVPDVNSPSADQMLIIDPTGGFPNHIHLRPGGEMDNSSTSIILGGESSNVSVVGGQNPPVQITSNNYVWQFETNGTILFPDYSVQTTAFTGIDSSSFVTTGSNTFIGNQTIDGSLTIVTPTAGVPNSISNWENQGGWNQAFYSNVATTGGTGTGLTIDVAAGGGGYVNIEAVSINTPGSGYTNGDVITIDNENNLPATFTIGIEEGSAWTFNTSGSLTTPGDINVSGSVNIDNVIKLTPVETFPIGQAGMLVASASYGKTNLYMYDGSDWKWLVTGSIA